MRILLVEDEMHAAANFEKALGAAGLVRYELTVAANRDEALRCLAENAYDFVVCDVWIPPHEGSAQTAAEHGISVYESLQVSAPGTPCAFLTGQPASDVESRRRLENARTEDLYGSGVRAMVALRTKAEVLYCAKLVAEAADELDQVRACECVGLEDTPLLEDEERVVQIFARRHGGERVEVTRFSGKSSATALRVEVFDSAGQRMASVFAKVGPFAKVRDEEARYSKYVPVLLPPGMFPAIADKVSAGAGKTEGIFFNLAAGYDESLFSCLCEDPARAASVIQKVREGLRPWEARRESAKFGVRALREREISDDDLRHAPDGVRWVSELDVEGATLSLSRWPQHGDLHGGNILIRGDEPLLVDFADAGLHPAAYDAVVLELSMIFHPDSPLHASNPHRPAEWPSVDQASHWWDVDAFADGSPAEGPVKTCRAWAKSLGDERSIAAIGYAHAIRQLKFADTDDAIAVAIATSAGAILKSLGGS